MVDFGLAKKCAGLTYTLCGTPAYAPPEVYAVKGHDKGVDWWTFGVLMHELLAGYTPFVGSEANEIYSEIRRYQKHYPRVAFPSHFPKPAQAMLKDLLHPISAHVRRVCPYFCLCFFCFSRYSASVLTHLCLPTYLSITPLTNFPPHPSLSKTHTQN